MPVILDPDAWPLWLGEAAADSDTLKALLAPYPAERMAVWPVDKRVGNIVLGWIAADETLAVGPDETPIEPDDGKAGDRQTSRAFSAWRLAQLAGAAARGAARSTA